MSLRRDQSDLQFYLDNKYPTSTPVTNPSAAHLQRLFVLPCLHLLTRCHEHADDVASRPGGHRLRGRHGLRGRHRLRGRHGRDRFRGWSGHRCRYGGGRFIGRSGRRRLCGARRDLRKVDVAQLRTGFSRASKRDTRCRVRDARKGSCGGELYHRMRERGSKRRGEQQQTTTDSR